MQNHNSPAANLATPIEPTETVTEPVPRPQLPWHAEVGRLLAQAAAICIDHAVEVDTYMSGAWTAYVEARPGMRAQLEEAQLVAQLDDLRKLGRLGSA